MVKAVGVDWSTVQPRKHRHVCVKLGVLLLLTGFAFRLFVSRSVSIPPVSETSHLQQSEPAATATPGKVLSLADRQTQKGKCDLFTGKWIPNPSGPIYTNESCQVVEEHQNCMKNGRPDSEYLYWRWKPRNCELPHFDSRRFLKAMRNKHWAFVGDSISRNHVQSFICLLSQAEKAVEIYRREENKSKRWHFPTYNVTVSLIWSPFLVQAAVFEDINGVSTSDTELHLDSLDMKWSQQYPTFDYMVISGGKWFLKTAIYYENNKIVGCHYCKGKNLNELGFEYAYKKALQMVLDFIIKSNHKAMVLFRTSTPDHFENGEWFSGGTCDRTVPFLEGGGSLNAMDKILRGIEIQAFDEATASASKGSANIRLLDISGLSVLRPDGHPGPYRHYYPFSKDKNAKVQQDCLHWCLPGPIDTWNDLIMEMVRTKTYEA